jgi:hypothetical protein
MAHNSEEVDNCTGRNFVGPGHFVGQLLAVVLQLLDTPILQQASIPKTKGDMWVITRSRHLDALSYSVII